MSHFLHDTLLDIRTGRETWRVFTMLGTLAFAVTVTLQWI
jgi:hypothetical protein